MIGIEYVFADGTRIFQRCSILDAWNYIWGISEPDFPNEKYIQGYPT